MGIQLWGLGAAGGRTSEIGAGGRYLGFEQDLGISGMELSGVRAWDLGIWASGCQGSTNPILCQWYDLVEGPSFWAPRVTPNDIKEPSNVGSWFLISVGRPREKGAPLLVEAPPQTNLDLSFNLHLIQ